MLVQSFTPHVGIRDTWNAANTATQDAGRRTQGGSCRLGRLPEHIHTLAQLGAQLWFSSGILRIQWLLTGRNRGLVMLCFVCDSPRRFATITRCFPPSSSVRETLSWSRPSPEIPPVIPGDLRSPRGGWTIQTTTRQAKSAAAPDSAKRPSYRPYTTRGCRLAVKTSSPAQTFYAPVPGLGLRRNSQHPDSRRGRSSTGNPNTQYANSCRPIVTAQTSTDLCCRPTNTTGH